MSTTLKNQISNKDYDIEIRQINESSKEILYRYKPDFKRNVYNKNIFPEKYVNDIHNYGLKNSDLRILKSKIENCKIFFNIFYLKKLFILSRL